MPKANNGYELIDCPECNLRDKHSIAKDYYIQFLNRTDSMFKYKGLPDSIPERILERYLKTIGWCGIGKNPQNESELVCFFGGLGEKPDLYYQPTAIVMANPVMGTNTYKIGEDCVWAKNDSCARGISQLLSRYAHLLAENDISINIAQVTTRAPFVLTAETQNEVESAQKYLDDIEKGKLGVIKSLGFNRGVIPQPAMSDSSGGYIKSLIELHQYLKAQFNNDIGVGANFNMKRERINTAEAELNSPYLLPLVDEMLKFRKIMCEEVNAMFDQNWSVELDSAWELEDKQQTLDVENLDTSKRLEKEDEDD